MLHGRLFGSPGRVEDDLVVWASCEAGWGSQGTARRKEEETVAVDVVVATVAH